MVAINQRLLSKAPTGIYRDDRLTGFGVRIGPKGATFFAEYRPRRGGAQRRLHFAKLGAPHPGGGVWTVERARREALRLLGRAAGGDDPLAARDAERAKARPLTVAELAEEWLARDQADTRSLPETARMMRAYVLPVLGARPAAEVRRGDVLRLVEDLAGRAPVQSNRVLGRLKRLFRWAHGRELVAADPTSGLEPVAKERSRDRVLDDDELRLVLLAAERIAFPYGAIVRILVATGCRREEVGALQWNELYDLEGAEPAIVLAGDRTKTAIPRTVPLSPMALAVLRTVPRQAGPYLFGRHGEGPFKGWSNGREALDRALAALDGGKRLPAWTLHDLRRSVATGLQRLGCKLEVIEAVLGHVSGSRRGVVGVYQRHAFENEARAALAAWSSHLERRLGRS